MSMPRHRGGGHTWENLVTACKTCNHRKGGKTLEEARLRLHRPPFEPRSDIYSLFTPVPRRRAQRGVADLPVPGSELTDPRRRSRRSIPGPGPRGPGPARPVVGRPCCVRRRRLAARRPARPASRSDWDLATAARPERDRGALPGRRLRERVRDGGGPARRRRRTRSRPSAPTTTTPTSGGHTASSSATRSRLDLARRDFTVNALAWGAPRRRRDAAHSSIRTAAAPTSPPRTLRAVGDPRRAVRGGRAADGPGGPPRGDARVRDRAGDAGRRSGHSADLVRTCPASGSRPSSTKLLARRAAVDRAPAAGRHGPARRDLAGAGRPARRAPEQGPGRGPLGPHGPGRRRRARRTGRSSGSRRSLHDIGKPATLADGHFIGHDVVGAEMAGELLDRLRCAARACASGSSTWSASTCSATSRRWSDAAVRRFIAKIGPDAIDDLFAPARGGQRRQRRCRPDAGRARRAARARRGASSTPRSSSTASASRSTART